jgi:AAA domain
MNQPAQELQLAEPAAGKDAAEHFSAGYGLKDFVVQAPDSPAPTGRLRIRPLSQVPPRNVRWLVPGMIPLRTLTLVAGVGGLGKSTYLCGIAAKVTRGELAGPAGDVILVSYEDAAEEVLRPRIEAAQGDLDRVHQVYVEPEDGMVCLPGDIGELSDLIAETDSSLLVIDPIVAAVDLGLDTHKDQHCRHVLGQLARLAEGHDCAVAYVGHLNKASTLEAYLRIAGSTAFYNAARVVILVTEDNEAPDSQRIISQRKNNYGPLSPVERHVIETVLLDDADAVSGDNITTSRMRFLEFAEDVDRNDVLAAPVRERGTTKLDEALGWLELALHDGEWHDSEGLKKLAVGSGIAERTLQRASGEIGVDVERRGFPASTHWHLPHSRQTFSIGLGATEEEDLKPHGYKESFVEVLPVAPVAPTRGVQGVLGTTEGSPLTGPASNVSAELTDEDIYLCKSEMEAGS